LFLQAGGLGPEIHSDPIGDFVMPTTISLSSQTSVSVRSSRPINSDLIELVPIGLFCGIGLLVSLVAFLSGVQGMWI